MIDYTPKVSLPASYYSTGSHALRAPYLTHTQGKPKHHLTLPLVILLLLTNIEAVLATSQPSIDVLGVPADVENNIVRHLAIHDESCQLTPRRRKSLLNSAGKKTANALHALGYYRAISELQIVSQDECWSLLVTVTLGEPVRIDHLQIEIIGEAQNDRSFDRILETSPVQLGKQLHHGDYDQLKRSINNLSLQRGYTDGQFTKRQLLINIKENSARIELTYNSGPRHTFGPVSFTQNIFDTSFLTRYIPFSEQSYFDADLLGQFQQSLIDSRYFEEVSVEQLPPAPNTRNIPLEVTLSPQSKYATALGAGIATDTGPRGSVTFNNNRSNRRGHRYSANLELSALRSAFDYGYRIPLLDPSKEQAKLQFGWEKVDTSTAGNETWSLGIFRTTTTQNEWLRTVDLVYLAEAFNIAGESANTQLLMPGIGWRRSRANNMVYPTLGWRLQTSFRGAAKQLTSDVSFLQIRGSVKYIKAFGPGRILGRVDAGATIVSQFADLPASLRFFAGGDASVRGYDYEELGPFDSQDEVIGGKHLLTTSLEYDFPIINNYDLALFFDAGNAFNDSTFTIKRSAGIGVRWRSPIGPIRLDFAFPINDQASFRLHLSMGPDL